MQNTKEYFISGEVNQANLNLPKRILHVIEQPFMGVVEELLVTRKVSPNWSQETMTCHSSNCFSVFFFGSGKRTIATFSSEQLLHDPFLHWVYDVLFFLAIWHETYIEFSCFFTCSSIQPKRVQQNSKLEHIYARSTFALFFLKWVITVIFASFLEIKKCTHLVP